ncbi:CAZyme family GT1 [Penicillium roqueforti]|nr:CAZyme family GT1 [Penicillium roqueforti]KAI2740303.1 CAZyme family GT1 [Penicillium roqueforti]KAI2765821.1 CAZyme family GT1 [Penicillium roqueforti]KAI3207794.1 CAZyme family GT1 [Penicillium roqueforti]
MATVLAPNPAEISFERMDINRSGDWASEDTKRASDDPDGVQFFEDGLNARILGDGRVDIHIDQHKPHLGGLLKHIQRADIHSERDSECAVSAERPYTNDEHFPLHLNLVIQVIGSRGDIQPFVALGKELKAHGHRVRLATHLAFRQFVLDTGLEFFNIGGDPEELMAYMVKNPGLLPGFKAIRSGDIQRRRREMKEIFNGCWKSCFEKGDGTYLHQIKEDPFSKTVDYRQRPFVADAIIANPPSLAHIHCAQRLGIPLHIIFTMPWSPTQSFPHPLANVHRRNCKPTIANFVSYNIVDMMVWEGLGDILNTLRRNTLALQPLDTMTAPSILHRLHVPHTYMWSPSLLPKPPDWADNIDVCGFGFLLSETSYTPPTEIAAFLDAGPKPIYIGFGSIVVDNANKLTKTIFEAVKNSGQRALISKGWGNLGADEVPDNILMIGNCPHDWLFGQVSCVIHHGGAGTTAAGLALGRPTIIVPFFGDQQFWGNIVARAGAGPAPIPHKILNVQNLSSAIAKALEPSTLERAQTIALKMQEESGVRHGVNSFHRNIDPQSYRCSIVPNHPAAWHLKHTRINLSAFAATVLVRSGKISPDMLVLYRPIEYDTLLDPADPLTASAQVLFGVITSFVTGLVDAPREIVHEIVSAARSIRQPHEHFDRHAACQAVLSSPDHLSPENNDGTETHIQNENEQLQIENEEQRDGEILEGEIAQEDTTDADNETDVNSIDRIRSTERKRNIQLEKAKTMSSSMTPTNQPKSTILHEAALHGSQMFKKILKIIIVVPTDLTLSMARGFHNAPKLYHDTTVTDIPQVVSLRSGFRAAGKEFRDGFYFGIKGLGTQPHHGLKHGGAKGLLKGVGKGIGGLFLKPTAGLWGLAGYPLSGIVREINDSLGRHQKCMIVMGRISQGLEEMRESTAQEREEVSRGWITIEHDLKKLKTHRHLHMSDSTHAVVLFE